MCVDVLVLVISKCERDVYSNETREMSYRLTGDFPLYTHATDGATHTKSEMENW